MTDLIGLLVFVAANFAAASSGAFFKPGEWYENLNKPSWRPPNWLFAPVWSVLYLVMAVSGWMVWREAGLAGAAVPLAIYALHLLFNFAWSAIFFGMRRMDLAFYEIFGLWGTLVAVIVSFHPIDPLAAYIMIPYLLWASFAGFLNYTIWQMNKTPA